MNNIQKAIISIYALAIFLSLFVDDGAQTFITILVYGTLLATLLFFLWRTKKEIK